MSFSATQTAAYIAARESAALYRLPQPGCLRITGPDRRDFIQRQTTNDIRALTPERALLTVLTSSTARILDVWRLVDEPESETITVLTLPGRGASTAAYLRSRIFFMDKVKLADASAEFAQFEMIGPRAPEMLDALGVAAPPEPDAVTAGADALRALGADPRIAPGTRLIVAAAEADALLARLDAAGVRTLDEMAYEVLRIEAGLPAADREWSEDYTPLETNLDSAISGAKGCYTGQEIIARQVNFDKVTRRLAGLRAGRLPARGSIVSVEGRTVGTVTSSAESPRLGPLALAILKRPHHEPGTAVMIADEAGALTATVAALPFGV